MKPSSVLFSVALLAAVLCGGVSGDAGAANNAAVLKRNDKVLRVPVGHRAYVKRADNPSADPSADSSASSSKEEHTTSEKSSAAPKETSTPDATSDSESEQGSLEADQTDANSDDNNNNDNNNNNSADSQDNQAGESNGDVVTDAQGNPIVTNLDVSYWEMITPSGVNFLSGASRVHIAGASASAAWGAALLAAAML
ncbi:hypothetical protein H4217_009481 [Coemansia sp. RSA 1939]|nr:hypothetical protein H4217_009481 [Coemansia sp. RSA 1939]KAJ2586685.1 hypothetical protein EV177_009726 [Coemansia sp. RSA 1804]KAJ2640835.1 hypothetical protein GGH99_009024 [Coemansia sp. RSA 1285]